MISDTERGLERLCGINKQREIIALNRQRTQQQSPDSTTVIPPGVRVNARYINSAKGTSDYFPLFVDSTQMH